MFLEVLDNLMLKHGLNKSSLSKQSGIPYTTIDGFYKKGYANAKLSTLRQLAQFFEVSLDYLVDDNVQENNTILNNNENKILSSYRSLNTLGQQKAMEYIRLLLLDSNYKKIQPMPPEKSYEIAAWGGQGTGSKGPGIGTEITGD